MEFAPIGLHNRAAGVGQNDPPRGEKWNGLMPTEIKTVVLHDHLYDTLFLPENMPANRAHLFVIPVGQYAGRKIKMFEHTNMFIPGSLPMPESFALREIRCAFYQNGEYIEPPMGALHLDLLGRRVTSFPLSAITSDTCRSLTCVRPQPYGEGFKELADKQTPVIAKLEAQYYFSCILELDEHSDTKMEFLTVLIGDHEVWDGD